MFKKLLAVLALLLAAPVQAQLVSPDGGLGVVVSPVPSGLTRYNATSTIKQKLLANTADVTVLFLTDSTGDSSTEYVHKIAEQLEVDFPTHTVDYRLFGASDYGAPETIGTGSGSRTLHIYNTAISGSTLDNVTGALFNNAVVNVNADAIIIGHGENLTGLTDNLLRGRYLGPLEQIMLAKPNIPIAMILQNPRRDDTLLNQIINIETTIANERKDIEIIDVHSLFILQNKDASLYIDSIHPSTTGTALYLQAWNAKFFAAPAVQYIRGPPYIATSGTNLLLNGNFAGFSGATPDNWSKGGNGALTKDTSIVYPGKAYSVKLVNGSTVTSLSQTINAVPYRGLRVTLRARIYIETAANLNSGRTRYFDNGAGTPVVAQNPGAVGLGGWREIVIADTIVANDATTVGAFVYANSSASTAGTIYIDEIMLNVGTVPRGF